jgi:hypothetical protein
MAARVCLNVSHSTLPILLNHFGLERKYVFSTMNTTICVCVCVCMCVCSEEQRVSAILKFSIGDIKITKDRIYMNTG